jgi:hypothetical protein
MFVDPPAHRNRDRTRSRRRALQRATAIFERLEHRLVLSAPPLPVIPNNTFLITNYGASTASANNATAIQNAISAATAAGGGTVEIPGPGTFMSGPITLATKINLQIDAGATLKAVAMANYPNNTSPANFISISSKNNVEISGSGTIDGNGQDWWTAYIANNAINRPRLINASGSNDTLWIRNVTLQYSPQFDCALSGSNNVTIDGITIFNPTSNTSNISPNTDGIDMGGSHWLIQNCTIDTGDDNIVAKPGSTASSDMTVTNCTFKHGHGMSIGGQTGLGLNGLTVTNCTFDGTTTGIRMKCDRRQNNGGLVQNCTYSNITMYNVEYPININTYYNDGTIPSSTETTDPPQAIGPNTPFWKNITISNLTATWDSSRPSYYSGAASGSYCGVIWGIPEAPVQNVSLSNVNITSAKYGMVLNHIRNVHFDRQTTFTPATGGVFIQTKSGGTPIDVVYWSDGDVNSPSLAGNSIYDVPSGNYTMTAGGADFGTGSTDQFNFNSTAVSGDCTVIADVVSQSSSNASAKAGVMIRNSATANNAGFAAVVVTPGTGVQFLWRNGDGGTLGSATVAGQVAPLWVRITRSGNNFTAYYSANGTAWTQIGSAQSLNINTATFAGLAGTAHDNVTTTPNTIVFSNVEVLDILTAAAASPSPVTGTQTQLTLYGSDSLSGAGPTYTWAATTKPAGSTVSYLINGTSPACFTTATLTPGSYTFQVTMTDTHGVSMTSSVSLVVEYSTINGTSGNDTIRLVRNGAALEVYVNNITSTPTYTVPYASQTQAFTVAGLAGNDNIIVDFSGGATPVPTAGITTDGTTGGSSDTLTITGTSGNDTATVNATTIAFNGSTITYANMESIVVNSGAGSDTLTQTAQPGGVLSFTGGASDTLNINSGNYAFPAPSAGAGIVATSFNTLSIAMGSTVSLATAAQHSDRTVLSLSTLTILGGTDAWTGKLDLGGNDLIVSAGNLTTITNQIKSGLNAAASGYWNGNGITSSTAAADAAHLTALGVLLNNAAGSPVYGTGTFYGPFDGQSPASAAVLVKFTDYGDTDLNGVVDGGDYSRIDNGFNMGLTNWVDGNFNYDAAGVDGADYALIDNTFNSGGGGLSAQTAVIATVSLATVSVPTASHSASFAVAPQAQLQNPTISNAAITSPAADDILDLSHSHGKRLSR